MIELNETVYELLKPACRHAGVNVTRFARPAAPNETGTADYFTVATFVSFSPPSSTKYSSKKIFLIAEAYNSTCLLK